jgi:hypothetical protein
LPKEATKPTRINLQSRLQRPNEVETDDPVELITLAGHATPSLRHHARVKLCLAQFRLEEYRHGYAPELLRRQARDMEAFLRRRLFTEAEGEPITILVDRDPNHSYCCTGWTWRSSSATKPGSAGKNGWPWTTPTPTGPCQY